MVSLSIQVLIRSGKFSITSLRRCSSLARLSMAGSDCPTIGAPAGVGVVLGLANGVSNWVSAPAPDPVSAAAVGVTDGVSTWTGVPAPDPASAVAVGVTDGVSTWIGVPAPDCTSLVGVGVDLAQDATNRAASPKTTIMRLDLVTSPPM